MTLFSCQNKTGVYVCKPCEQIAFNESGICPHSAMDLIKKSALNPEKKLIVNEIKYNPSVKIPSFIQMDKNIDYLMPLLKSNSTFWKKMEKLIWK